MTTDTCKCGHPQGRHARLAGTYAHCIQKNPEAAYGRCGCGMYRPQDDEPAAAPSVPADADLRDQVLHALDFAYCNGIGYETPEQLLDAYDAHRPILPAPADRAAGPFVPPAADGLPLAALDSAANGASALDAWARDSHGRNFLAHALVQLARDGWLRTEPDHGFEPVRDRETPEPEDPAELRRMADEAQQAGGCPGCGCAEHRGFCDCGCLDDRRAAETQQAVTQAAADCPYGVGPGDGSGCIKPAGHDGDHVVTAGVPVMPCSPVIRHPHMPHSWRPQPGMAYVHCPGATTEAQQAGEAQQSEPSKPTVAYSGKGRVWCLRCPHPADENVPLNANDVNAWDLCPSCGRHVVDVAQAQQEADHA